MAISTVVQHHIGRSSTVPLLPPWLAPRLLVLAGLAVAPIVAPAIAQDTARDIARASPPAAALAWRDPGLAVLEREVERLAAELTPWGQFDYTARLDPNFRFRDYPGDEEPGTWSARVGLSASLSLGDAPDTYARALQTLERTRQRLYLLGLDGVSDALLAQANLLIEQEQERAAEQDFREAEQERAEAADLDLRLAQLDHRRARHELAVAQQVALSYGLEPKARYLPLRFRLPESGEVSHDETHDFRMLELDLREAEAELAMAQRAPLDDLRLRTGYRSRSMQVEVEGGLVNGAPGATLGFDVPGGVERWEVQISAQLVLDASNSLLDRLAAEVAAAQAALNVYPRTFAEEFARALVRAELAEAELDLAEEALELAVLADVPVARPTAARIRLYRSWSAYIRATAALLEVSGESWAAR